MDPMGKTPLIAAVTRPQPDIAPTRRPLNCDDWENYQRRLEGVAVGDEPMTRRLDRPPTSR